MDVVEQLGLVSCFFPAKIGDGISNQRVYGFFREAFGYITYLWVGVWIDFKGCFTIFLMAIKGQSLSILILPHTCYFPIVFSKLSFLDIWFEKPVGLCITKVTVRMVFNIK